MAKEFSLNNFVTDFTTLSHLTFLFIDFNLQPVLYSVLWKVLRAAIKIRTDYMRLAVRQLIHQLYRHT
jgi:hypothetical protein